MDFHGALNGGGLGGDIFIKDRNGAVKMTRKKIESEGPIKFQNYKFLLKII